MARSSGAEMARSLEIATVLVPPAPGVWSALGLLEAEMEHHLVRTFLRPLAGLVPGRLTAAVAALESEAAALLAAQGHQDVEITTAADLKYQGQSSRADGAAAPGGGATTRVTRHLAEAFARERERASGHKAEGDPIQVVDLRLDRPVCEAAERRAMRLGDAGRGAARGASGLFRAGARIARHARDRAAPISASARGPAPC